jgi:hypothetical protein
MNLFAEVYSNYNLPINIIMKSIPSLLVQQVPG